MTYAAISRYNRFGNRSKNMGGNMDGSVGGGRQKIGEGGGGASGGGRGEDWDLRFVKRVS